MALRRCLHDIAAWKSIYRPEAAAALNTFGQAVDGAPQRASFAHFGSDRSSACPTSSSSTSSTSQPHQRSLSTAGAQLRHSGLLRSLLPQHTSLPHDSFATSSSHCGRSFASAPTTSGDGWQLHYEGPQSRAIGWLKLVSVSTATLTLLGSPMFVMISSADGMAAKVLGAAGFTMFSLFTTGLLHWFVRPYVHKLWYNPETREVKVSILTIFAQHRDLVFPLDTVKYPDAISPLQTFAVDGVVLFLDSNFFDDKELLAKLTPDNDCAMPAGYVSDGDDDDEGGGPTKRPAATPAAATAPK